MEKGMQRWVVDISMWEPSNNDFTFALSLLPQHLHYSITRFLNKDDRKRALVSMLLQYTLVLEILGIQYEEVVILRTLEGKPFLECGRVCLDFPNFNFNVSHHGDYVAIASEPLCLVGLDIVSHKIPERGTVLEFIQNFSSCFSSLEWDQMINAGSNDEILTEFYRYWCLKEAFVKAVGSGLAYGLHKVEFSHTRWTNISVKVDGVRDAKWRFWLSELGKGHFVSVAKGHPSSATESYMRTLKQIEFTEKEYNEGLLLPSPKFVFRTVEQLVSVMFKAKCSQR